MRRYCAYLLLLLILVPASSQAASWLFESPKKALRLVANLGPNWSDVKAVMTESDDEGRKITRYEFDRSRFASLKFDNTGQIIELYLFSGPLKAKSGFQDCSALPKYDKVAKLLIDALEPDHSKYEYNRVLSAARIGWNRALGNFLVLAGRTVFRFSSYASGCQFTISRDPEQLKKFGEYNA